MRYGNLRFTYLLTLRQNDSNCVSRWLCITVDNRLSASKFQRQLNTPS